MLPTIPSKSNGAFKQVQLLHLVRFGEAIELLRRRLDEKNVYYMNPALNLQA